MSNSSMGGGLRMRIVKTRAGLETEKLFVAVESLSLIKSLTRFYNHST